MVVWRVPGRANYYVSRHYLGACLDAVIAVSVSRWLTQPYPYGLVGSYSSCYRHFDLDVGAFRRNIAALVTFCVLMCLGILPTVASRSSFGTMTTTSF